MRIVRYASLLETPWKNGGGVTREIARGPGWRIALATIERDGEFSDFSGYDRTIVPVEGNGFTLEFDDGSSALLERPFEPFRFSGDRHVVCRLIDGPSRDLNVMTERDRWKHEARAVRLSERAEPFVATVPSFVIGMRGAARVTSDGTSAELGFGDALVCEDARSFDLAGAGALVLAVRLVTPRG